MMAGIVDRETNEWRKARQVRKRIYRSNCYRLVEVHCVFEERRDFGQAKWVTERTRGLLDKFVLTSQCGGIKSKQLERT